MSKNAQTEEGRAGTAWQGHRVAAMALRVVIFLCPASLAAGLGLLADHSVHGTTAGWIVVRVVGTAAASVAAFILVERLARRFLPLAALLRLSLVFPDKAPSRFSLALRSTSVRKLHQWVAEARASQDAAVVAEKVVTLAAALNTHDRRTRGHCERTRALADLIVDELHLPPAQANEVRWGAFLHDIGKLVVPAEILNKPGKPTAREWEILKSHPEAGARLVEPLRGFLSSGVDAVGSHHENYDGTGYPAGLAGDDLPLAARIVSVADAFEVMTAVRAYKRPMSLQAARQELARRGGSQFDPQVVRAFLNVSLGRVHWTLGFAAWLAELPFLSFLPRLAAQVSTTATGGLAAPAVLPGVAAASLGALAVIGHVHPSTAGRPTAVATAPSVPASPVPRTSAEAPVVGSRTPPDHVAPSPTVSGLAHGAPVVPQPLPAVVAPTPPPVDPGPLPGSTIAGQAQAVLQGVAATVAATVDAAVGELATGDAARDPSGDATTSTTPTLPGPLS